MSRYRSKPAIVEAFQWNGQPQSEWPEWARKATQEDNFPLEAQIDENGSALRINHPAHGSLRVNLGDWIIRVNEDDIYPCSDEVFQKRWEEIK